MKTYTKAEKAYRRLNELLSHCAQEARHGVFVASEGRDTEEGSETPLNAVQEAEK